MQYLLSFLAGILTSGYFNDTMSLIVIGILMLVFFICFKKTMRIKKTLICCVLFFVGLIYYISFDFVVTDRFDGINNEDISMTITLTSDPKYTNNIIKFTGIIEEYGKKADVTMYDTPYMSSYDKVVLKGNIYSINKNKEQSYSENIYYKVISYDKNSKVIKGDGFGKAVYKIREKFLYILENNFSYNSAMFLKGIILGNDDLRSEEFNNGLRRLSLSHIVSVSGMHFSLIVMFLLFWLRRLKISRKYVPLVVIPFSFLLAFFIGFTPSVVRVLIMSTILSLADIFGRERVTDIYLLVLTAFLMIVFNVYYIHNVAFILSFTSLAGILLFVKPIESKSKIIPQKVKSYLAVPFAANIGTLPFVLYYFKGLPLLSVLSNFIIVPFVSIALLYGIIVIIISFININLGGIIGIPLDFMTDICVKLICYGGKLPFGYVETLTLDKYFIILYYSLFVLFKIPKRIFKYLLIVIISVYFSVNLFFPLDRVFLPYAEMYYTCGKESGLGVIVYKDKSICINNIYKKTNKLYKIISEQCEKYFDIYVACNNEAIEFISANNINIDKLYIPARFKENQYYFTIASKYAEEVIPVKSKYNLQFYDFSLTLDNIEDYNISRVLIEHKDNKVVFMSGEVLQPEYNTKYILDYYILDKYKNSNFVLNCFNEEFERVKI